jgi:hypothetical protein
LAYALNLSRTAAVAAADRLGSFARTAAIAVIAPDRQFQIDADLVAEHRLFQR